MRLFKSSFAALVMGLLFSTALLAQNMTVSGVVSDANNEPLVGAAVMVKGTSTGVVTDINGKYSIQASSNAVLICQSIGYKTVEEAVSGRSVINFTLADDAQVLDATVVVGYGTLKKTQLSRQSRVKPSRTEPMRRSPVPSRARWPACRSLPSTARRPTRAPSASAVTTRSPTSPVPPLRVVPSIPIPWVREAAVW